MTASWARRTLGDVLSVQNGYAFDSKAFGAVGFPLIRIRDLKAGVSTETRYGAEFDPKYVVNAGDFLIGMDGEFGCYEWNGEPALLNQRVCRLQGFAQALEPRFLFYGINAHLKAIEEVTGYTTVKHLSSKQILGIKMPVPPRDEQRRIVAILDEAFEGIATAKANAEKKLQNVREVYDSKVQSTFACVCKEWEAKALATACEVKDGTHDSPKYVADGIPFVTQKNIRADGLSFADTKFISKDDHANYYRRSNVAIGDILISMIGANRGMACLVDDDRVFSIKNVGLVKASNGVNPNYLLAFLKSAGAARYVQAGSKGGAQSFIGLTELRAFPVPLPPLAEQAAVATSLGALLGEIVCLEDLLRRKLVALDELKRSLLYQAFTGALAGKTTDKRLEAVA